MLGSFRRGGRPTVKPSEATLGGEQVVSGASHGQPFTSEVIDRAFTITPPGISRPVASSRERRLRIVPGAPGEWLVCHPRNTALLGSNANARKV
jgi:hypothetical protein